MKLKVYSYGNKVLTQEGDWIEENTEELQTLIKDMFETLVDTGGIGLAAHQVGKPIKLFIADLSNIGDQSIPGFRKVFINSEIIEESEDTNEFEEGSLSFPGIGIEVERPKKIKMYYQDENFNEYEEWFEGLPAIVLQHEHDHTEGIIFTSHAKPLKKQLLASKLKEIAKGKVQGQYAMKFPKKR